jgi:hypothetical protein
VCFSGALKFLRGNDIIKIMNFFFGDFWGKFWNALVFKFIQKSRPFPSTLQRHLIENYTLKKKN